MSSPSLFRYHCYSWLDDSGRIRVDTPAHPRINVTVTVALVGIKNPHLSCHCTAQHCTAAGREAVQHLDGQNLSEDTASCIVLF